MVNYLFLFRMLESSSTLREGTRASDVSEESAEYLFIFSVENLFMVSVEYLPIPVVSEVWGNAVLNISVLAFLPASWKPVAITVILMVSSSFSSKAT